MVDIKTFDLWLEHRRYLKSIITRKLIINIYKKYLKEGLTVIEFEEHLSDIGFEDSIYEPISKYLINWNYRNKENKLLMEELNGK